MLHGCLGIDTDVSENNGIPKSSIFIGFSIIFTIHFGGNTPIFGSTPIRLHVYPYGQLRVSFSEARCWRLATLVASSEPGEAKTFFLKMQGDYYRHLAVKLSSGEKWLEVRLEFNNSLKP